MRRRHLPGLNNSNWTNVFNWENAQLPVNDGTADVVIPDTPRDNSNVNDPWSIKSLTFQGPANLEREWRPARRERHHAQRHRDGDV